MLQFGPTTPGVLGISQGTVGHHVRKNGRLTQQLGKRTALSQATFIDIDKICLLVWAMLASRRTFLQASATTHTRLRIFSVS